MNARFWSLVAVGLLSPALCASAEPVPSLDELLGLAEAAEESEETIDQAEADLDRALSDGDPREQLTEAVDLMGDISDRLVSDSGLPTQRLQEDVIRKLDMVIASAEKQQQQQSSSSSSSSSQQQQQQQQSAQQQSSQNQRQEGQQSGQRSGEVGLRDASTEADLRSDLIRDPAAWGKLPVRMRDSLRQGMSDRFSSIYQRMTERYYERIAEEGGR